ncbi:MAG: acyl-CoA dehydrogenase C-terminal domain-containing protein [Alphaproteobacteria bacterium]|nr:acyl-CoA dehydrogenase C-terminal domain-containing protein [Alphaproteobacteria bacterium]
MAGGAAFDELFDDIEQTIEACDTSSHPDLPPLGERLRDSLESMREAVDWLKEADMQDRLAGATPFQTLAGETVGGWLLCVGAVAARRRQKEEIGDPAFAAERIALANFFAESVMTLAPSRVDDITMGSEMIADVGF